MKNVIYSDQKYINLILIQSLILGITEREDAEASQEEEDEKKYEEMNFEKYDLIARQDRDEQD